MRNFIRSYLLCLMPLIGMPAGADEPSDQQRYLPHDTVLGFKLLDTPLSTIMDELRVPFAGVEDAHHEISGVCVTNSERSQSIHFLTGVIHDYDNLYGYQISSDVSNDCLQSDHLPEQIMDGAGFTIGMRRTDVFQQLGEATGPCTSSCEWKLNFSIAWPEPVISQHTFERNGKQVTAERINRGSYHLVLIRGEFENEQLVDFRLVNYAEGDSSVSFVEH